MALERAAMAGGFSPDWQQLNSDSSQWRQANGAPRYYLYTLKAMAFIKLRCCEFDLAREILDKLLELDQEDQVGASVISQLLLATVE